MVTTQLERRTRTAVLVAVLLVLFLASLDQTVVGTALPRIVTDLHGDNLYTWVVTAYLLTSTVTIPIYGKLSDVYGRKPMLLLGVSLFLVGSALSGLSQTMGQLIAFRGVQGLGAGALFPISLAIIGDLFSARERGRYQGLFGAVFGLSFILGPFIGGFLTDNVSWHWVFYVNLPVGIVALAVVAFVMPNLGTAPGSAGDLDYLGIALLTAALVPLLIGLTDKGQNAPDGSPYGWLTPQVGGLILVAVVLGAVFIFVESRAKEPVVPLDLFKDRTTAAILSAVFFFGFGMFTAIIYLPRFYQSVRGVSATQSGYEIWPLLVGLIGASMVGGLVITRTGKYKRMMLGSIVVLIIGAYLMTNLQPDTSSVVIWAWMLLLGVGIGPSMAGYTTVMQSAVPMSRLGVATSTLTLLRQIGGSVSLAIAGTIFNAAFTSKLPQRLAANGVPREVANPIVNAASSGSLGAVGSVAGRLGGSISPALQAIVPRIVSSLHQAETAAIAQLFWLTIAAAAAAFLCTLVMREVPLRSGPALRQLQAEELTAPKDTEPLEQAAAS
ncbi:MAG TPA: MDR family MFS transporter [Candidatus Dormibacteraeota bacterium]|nr:MDR family MFS transporter [Candidatus Dormibacteraeota bacterium]